MPRFAFLALLLSCSLVNPLELQAAPQAELWPRWQAHDAGNDASIDHRSWEEILGGYLYEGKDGINRFDYAGVSEADRTGLDRYLERMAQINISTYNRDVQRAYWINLYNALTVREVLRFYPVASIRDISSGFFSFGPWDKKLIEVEGEALTLNDIEHRILRPIWRDARIHYALNCASLGCPNLRVRAFTGGNTDAMLDQAAREFINHPRGARVVDGKLRVSSIYVWFIDDFGGDDAGVIRHLQQYADSSLARALKDIRRIDGDDYDWRLNSLVDKSDARRLGQAVGLGANALGHYRGA
jgi:hypothetical protein